MEGARKQSRVVAAAVAALLAVGWLGSGSPNAHELEKHALKAKKKGGGNGDEKQFDLVTLAEGFKKPTSVDWTPEGQMLVSEKRGRIFSVQPGGDKRILLDLSDHVNNILERGLQTVEVASDFESNRRVYLLYSYEANKANPTGPQAMRVSYITLNSDGTVANRNSPETLVLGRDADGPCPPVTNNTDCPASVGPTHQGGGLFSDSDGTLWVSLGDSNVPSQPGPAAFRTFNPASTAGKLLHIDANGNGLEDHPFCKKNDDLTDTCTKVYARGFRNPFRVVLGPRGDPVISDVGWNSREEIDFVQKGRNYGWPCFEGRVKTPFYSDTGRCAAFYRGKPTAMPAYDYRNPMPGTGAGASVMVGPPYPGGAYPDDFEGGFFFADYAQGFIKLLLKTKKGVRLRPVITGVTPVGFSYAPNGNLTFVDFRAKAIRELVFAPGNKAPRAQISAVPTSGPVPLPVTFTSANSTDADNDPIGLIWDFGDGTSSNEVSPTHTYTASGVYKVKLTANDGLGGTSMATTTITVGNSAPVVTVLSPTPATVARGDEPVQLLATATDAEEGLLPDSAFNWDVTLVHKAHEHPIGEFIGGSVLFPAQSDHDADSFYEVVLTVTDSKGLVTETPKMEIRPQVVPLKIASEPKGIKLSYGGRTIAAPKEVESAVGYRATLSAPATATIGGRQFRFAGWSQKGKRVQVYEIPAEESAVKAKYVPAG